MSNSSPSGIRDLLAAHAAVRVGRLDRYPTARRLRSLTLRLLAREGKYVRARISDGLELTLPAADRNLMQAILAGHLFETGVADSLRRVLRPGDVFVDGGAHVGLYTLIGAKRVGPNGLVIAFEPHPLNAELLRLNIARNHLASTVVVEEAALCARAGIADFCWSPTLTTHGRLLSSPAPDSRSTPVHTMDLANYVTLKSGRVDVIKLDLEGGEVEALTGMSSLLGSVRCVIMEVNEPRIKEQGLEPGWVVARARDLGRFENVHVLPLAGGPPQPLESLPEELASFGWTNVLFDRQEREDKVRPR